MKLSENQAKVIRLMQEGWELGVDTTMVGHTRIIQTGRLQKHGLGHGYPSENCKATTVHALERKGLITHKENPYVMVEPTRYILTEKGKEWKE